MTHPLIATVEERFAGVLTHGSHSPDGQACLLEAVSIARSLDWTDDPDKVAMPDLRPLNDAPWSSDEVRTKHLLPVGVALYDWADWPKERQQAFAERVAEQTIRAIVPMALRLAAEKHPHQVHKDALMAAAARCSDEGTESAAWAARAAESAESAARAAWAARAARAAESAAESAESAARAARAAESAESAAWAARAAESAASAAWAAAWAESAAWAARAASADEPLILVCRIFVEAAAMSRYDLLISGPVIGCVSVHGVRLAPVGARNGKGTGRLPEGPDTQALTPPATADALRSAVAALDQSPGPRLGIRSRRSPGDSSSPGVSGNP